jgi:hypothetical protein
LLECALEINDDINKTFLRYDNLKMSKGKGSFKPSSTTNSYLNSDVVYPNNDKFNNYKEFKKEVAKIEARSVTDQVKPQSNTNLIDIFDYKTDNTKTTNSNNLINSSSQNKNDLLDIFSQVPVTTNNNSINIMNPNIQIQTGNNLISPNMRPQSSNDLISPGMRPHVSNNLISPNVSQQSINNNLISPNVRQQSNNNFNFNLQDNTNINTNTNFNNNSQNNNNVPNNNNQINTKKSLNLDDLLQQAYTNPQPSISNNNIVYNY